MVEVLQILKKKAAFLDFEILVIIIKGVSFRNWIWGKIY
jgi:hypothetical protein